MRDTTTDRYSEAQEKILQHRIQSAALYPSLWKKIISEWNAPDPRDQGWLTYSASYIFRTSNTRWAIDPFTLDRRLKIPHRMDLARDLQSLSFVLLTHAHSDHLDLDLISALRQLPITWVVPEYLLPEVVEQAGLPPGQIVVPSQGTTIELYGLQVIPFDGQHWEMTSEGTMRGVPSMGYLIASRGRRWLFPGDTRTFAANQLPRFDPVDMTFAHLWLGRGSALEDSPPLLDAFCRFFLDTNPRYIILTHLNELGREAVDYWDKEHARLTCSYLRKLAPGIPVRYLQTGDSFAL